MTKILKLKLIYLYFILYLLLINNYLLLKYSNIDSYFINEIKSNYYLNKNKNIKNKHLLFYIKKNLCNKIKNLNQINKLFLSTRCRFGNCLLYLNNYISFCEKIGCKSIILDKNIFWFIKNNIILKNNIEIKVDDRKNINNYFKFKIFFDNFFNFKNEINILLLRDEIINNLPKIKISENDLYIHIRSEDIFNKKKRLNEYAQPPLCFYMNILQNFKFQNIFIISFDKANPVINKLINYYPTIIFKKNNLLLDISYLINAYNIVNSISSFFISSLILNYNIKFLWDYNSFQ